MKFTLLGRAAVLALSLVFSWQASGAFPMKIQAKTCCGRSICTCTHAKGAFCHFKHLNGARHVPGRGLAPLSQTNPRWNAAPCHSPAPQTVLPTISKEFDHGISQSFSFASKPEFLILNSQKIFLPLSKPRIDRPPRVF